MIIFIIACTWGLRFICLPADEFGILFDEWRQALFISLKIVMEAAYCRFLPQTGELIITSM
jgi:hypothetical protein